MENKNDETMDVSDEKGTWDICEKKYGWFLTYRWELASRVTGVRMSNPSLFKRRGVGHGQ